METYTSWDSLKKDWKTLEDLYVVLKEQGYPANKRCVSTWEQKGIIPPAKRVLFRGNEWRVYAKDGSDFLSILQTLHKHGKKRVFTPA